MVVWLLLHSCNRPCSCRWFHEDHPPSSFPWILHVRKTVVGQRPFFILYFGKERLWGKQQKQSNLHRSVGWQKHGFVAQLTLWVLYNRRHNTETQWEFWHKHSEFIEVKRNINPFDFSKWTRDHSGLKLYITKGMWSNDFGLMRMCQPGQCLACLR